nr:cytochrome P450 6k1-like [Nomia melanderi]
MAYVSLILNSVFIATIIWLAVYYYMKKSHTYWQKRGIPADSGHWFFGNVKDAVLFRRNPTIVISELFAKSPPDLDVYGIYILNKRFLLLKNPEVIKHVLVKDFHSFENRYFTGKSRVDTISSSNLFTIGNPEWKQLRTKVSPVFTSGKMKKWFHLIAETTVSMSNYLRNEFANGVKTKVIMMQDTTLKFTTDIISTLAFGIHVNSFDPNNNEFFRKAQEGLSQTFTRSVQFFCMFFFPKYSEFIPVKLLGNSTDYLRSVFWDAFENRETTKEKRGDLIDFMIELRNNKQQDNEFKMEGDVLVSQAAIFFVAGRDSSVTTMCFTLYELARNPDIQKRVRDEIFETMKNQGLTYESVQDMKYMNQAMSEALRLYPPAPLLDRVATTDYKIPGTDIVLEKGTPVYVCLYALHRDPRFFANPDTYDPDRFSDENKSNIKPFTYMPFGEGPRACVGMRLGMLQSMMAVITILKDYEVALDPDYKYQVDPYNIFFITPADFKFILTKL